MVYNQLAITEEVQTEKGLVFLCRSSAPALLRYKQHILVVLDLGSGICNSRYLLEICVNIHVHFTVYPGGVTNITHLPRLTVSAATLQVTIILITVCFQD